MYSFNSFNSFNSWLYDSRVYRLYQPDALSHGLLGMNVADLPPWTSSEYMNEPDTHACMHMDPLIAWDMGSRLASI